MPLIPRVLLAAQDKPFLPRGNHGLWTIKNLSLEKAKKLAIRQFSNSLCDGRPGIIVPTSAMLTRLNCILSFFGVTIKIFMIIKLINLFDAFDRR